MSRQLASLLVYRSEKEAVSCSFSFLLFLNRCSQCSLLLLCLLRALRVGSAVCNSDGEGEATILQSRAPSIRQSKGRFGHTGVSNALNESSHCISSLS